MVSLMRFLHEIDHGLHSLVHIQIPEKVAWTFDFGQKKPFIIDKGADIFFYIGLPIIHWASDNQGGDRYFWQEFPELSEFTLVSIVRNVTIRSYAGFRAIPEIYATY